MTTTTPALHKWEKLDDDERGSFFRCRVPGGWLYQVIEGEWEFPDGCADYLKPTATALAFVPDAS